MEPNSNPARPLSNFGYDMYFRQQHIEVSALLRTAGFPPVYHALHPVATHLPENAAAQEVQKGS